MSILEFLHSNLRPFKEFSRRRKQSENVRHIPYVANKAYNFHYMFGESMKKILWKMAKQSKSIHY